jgi:transposase
MPKRIEIKPHLSIEQLATCYRKSEDAVERSHYQMIWLLAQGQSTAEVARVTGYSVYWVRVIARRYNAQGDNGLSDLRHANPGGECMLSAAQQAELEQAMQSPPDDGGPWNGPKVARWMAALLGRSVHEQRGWDYLQRLGYSAQLPRPRHAKANAEEQAVFKKRSVRKSKPSNKSIQRPHSNSGRRMSIVSG